jgi:type VII secretion protein EccB
VHGTGNVWTQRDQIQAYQFLRRRLVSALVAADANHPTSPNRRLVLGSILGVAAAVLITAVFGVLGVLNPSSTANWQAGGQVIIEQETGARYVLGKDNLLHPVLNYASARLLAGGDGTNNVSVPSKNLASASRGSMLGIPGAPDSLPAADKVTDTAFTTCSRTLPDQPASAKPLSTLILGDFNNGKELGRNTGVLVQLSTGEKFLVTAGHHYPVSQAALVALGYDSLKPTTVSDIWLSTVPLGPRLDVIPAPTGGAGAGSPGPAVGGLPTRVGQVLGATNGEFYLVQSDGLESVTRTEASLLVNDPANAAAYPNGRPQVSPASAADIAAAGRSRDTSMGSAPYSDYPATVPVVVNPGVNPVLCAIGDGRSKADIVLETQLPLPSGGKVMPVSARTSAQVADEVYVPPGSGALVREQVAPGSNGPGEYLVTDAGQKYPVPTADDVKSLGYGNATPQNVSATLLALLPTGPPLDAATAEQVVLTSGGSR